MPKRPSMKNVFTTNDFGATQTNTRITRVTIITGRALLLLSLLFFVIINIALLLFRQKTHLDNYARPLRARPMIHPVWLAAASTREFPVPATFLYIYSVRPSGASDESAAIRPIIVWTMTASFGVTYTHIYYIREYIYIYIYTFIYVTYTYIHTGTRGRDMT